jgi:tripartite-type tricarboxylate transporter receptor subunit TctC
MKTNEGIMQGFLRSFVLMLAMAISLPAVAADYPNRVVKFIVPFGVGGPADIYARVLAQYLGEKTKQSFIVEDRPGAGSIIGSDLVAKSAPDGYTLLIMSNTHTTNETLVPNKPFQLMRDFVPVASINSSDLVMVVPTASPVKSVADFIALAKKEPGKLNYASSGPGTPYHMAAELFKAMAGVDVLHVPYKASGDARNGVVAGQVDMMFDAVTTMTELAKAGKVRALGTTGSKRSPLTPNLPTIAETVPGYEATIWIGVMAPKGTSKDVIAFLNKSINEVIDKPEVKANWLKQGAVPMMMTPDDFDAFLKKDIEKWAAVVKTSGATIH